MDRSTFETYRCELLIREIVYRADLGDRGSVADLFLPDGVFAFGDLELVGREAIREWFTATGSPARPLARHVCTNTTVRFPDPSRAEATTYLMLFREESPERIPAPLRGIQGVGVYRDDLVKVEDDWLFESRRYEPTFRADPTAS